MDPDIAYSVLVAFIWGVYIFILRRYFPGYSGAIPTTVVNAFAVLLYLPVTAVTYDPAVVPLLAELGATGVGIIAGTAVPVGVVFILFIDALEAGDVSYATPVNRLVPMFILPIEILLLDQFLTGVQILGTAATTVTVYAANYESGALLDPLRRAVRSRSVRLALVSVARYAVSDVSKRVALQELGIPTGVFVPVLFIGSALAILSVAVREWPGVRGDLPEFVATDVLAAIGEHITSAAFGLVSVSVTSSIVNTQAIVVVVLGGAILRGARLGTRLVAAVLMVVGVSPVAPGDAAALRALVG